MSLGGIIARNIRRLRLERGLKQEILHADMLNENAILGRIRFATYRGLKHRSDARRHFAHNTPVTFLHLLRRHIHLLAHLPELRARLRHARLRQGVGRQASSSPPRSHVRNGRRGYRRDQARRREQPCRVAAALLERGELCPSIFPRFCLAKFAFQAVPNIPFIYGRFVVLFEIAGTLRKPLTDHAFRDIMAALCDTPPYSFDRHFDVWQTEIDQRSRVATLAPFRIFRA
jgi:hypothetical protein